MPYEQSDSPYASDWSFGAFAPPGVIWVGEIPLPQARELVDQGWQVVGEPLPPFASTDEIPPANVDITPNVPPVTDTDVDAARGAGPPVTFDPGPPPPLDQGGPEERAPPDFDIPVQEAPDVQQPAVVPPPLEGELVGPDEIYYDYEGYDTLPGFGDIGNPPKRIIEGETTPPGTLETPPWWFGPVVRGIGRAVLGPIGGALPSVIEAGMPEVLGSGELPFPPIPRVDIPVPQVPIDFPSYPLPSPEVPQLSMPTPPDVVIATPTSPTPSFPAPRSSQTVPRALKNAGLWGLLGGLAPILRPIHRGRGQPSQAFGDIAQTFAGPEINPITPLPSTETLPRGVTIPATVESPQDLTAPTSSPVPLPGAFGRFGFMTPTDTTEDDRCKCKKNEKHEPDPSDVVANVKVYRRRMSNWSLKNLNRGTKAANLLRKFV